eukprot:6174279-Pleurochrysis_carterae.AAC.4
MSLGPTLLSIPTRLRRLWPFSPSFATLHPRSANSTSAALLSHAAPSPRPRTLYAITEPTWVLSERAILSGAASIFGLAVAAALVSVYGERVQQRWAARCAARAERRAAEELARAKERAREEGRERQLAARAAAAARAEREAAEREHFEATTLAAMRSADEQFKGKAAAERSAQLERDAAARREAEEIDAKTRAAAAAAAAAAN